MRGIGDAEIEAPARFCAALPPALPQAAEPARTARCRPRTAAASAGSALSPSRDREPGRG